MLQFDGTDWVLVDGLPTGANGDMVQHNGTTWVAVEGLPTNPAADDIIQWSGSAWEGVNGIDSLRWRDLRFKQADESRNADTTLAIDDHLFGWSLDASSKYLFEGVLWCDHNGTVAAGIKMNFDNTAAFTSGRSWIAFELFAEATAYLPAFVFDASDDGDPLLLATFPDVGEREQVIRIYGSVQTADATVVDLQWAQNTSQVVNTQLKRGSWAAFTKLT
jgi:hypothetical protein